MVRRVWTRQRGIDGLDRITARVLQEYLLKEGWEYSRCKQRQEQHNTLK